MNTKSQKKSCAKSGKLWDAFSVAIGVSKKPKKADTKDKTEKKTVAATTVKKPESVKKTVATTTVKKSEAEHGRKARKVTAPEKKTVATTTVKKSEAEHGRKARKVTAPEKTVKAGSKKVVVKGCGCGK